MKFYDIRDYLGDLRGISIIIGGRGIGKTYSALSFVIENKEPFMYLRNTMIQLHESASDFGNPFKKLNKDKGWDITMKMSKQHADIVDENGNIIGYGAALSTFENLRGVDLSDVKWVIFDEFIELRRLTFDQWNSFQKFYETVNRNRELFGEPPLKCIMLSNSQSLNNPILMGYNLIGVIEGMIASGQKKYKRDNIFLQLPESEISDLKKHTANYRMIKGTNVYEEALNNKFAHDSFYGVKKRNINEYKCICKVDDMYLYQHKSNGRCYVCNIQALNVKEFNTKNNGVLWYRQFARWLVIDYARGLVEFSDFTTKSKFMKIIE